jgi:hypothetical protein
VITRARIWPAVVACAKETVDRSKTGGLQRILSSIEVYVRMAKSKKVKKKAAKKSTK